MRFTLLVIVFCTCSTTLSAQITSARIQMEISNLRVAQIDTFLIYSLSCSGEMPPLDSCSNEEPQYLLWKKNNFYFLKRFDYCQSFKKIMLDTSNPLLFYLTHKISIDKEKIKSPTYLKSKRGKKSTEVSWGTPHDCHYKISTLFKNQKTFKSTSLFDLNFEKRFDNGKKNIYYNYNVNTKLKSLIDLLLKTFADLETSNKFVRDQIYTH